MVSSAFLDFFCCSSPYHQKCLICVIPTTASKRVSSLFWFSTQRLLSKLTALFILLLTTWIYIFIYTINLVRTSRAEPIYIYFFLFFFFSQFHFSWGEDKAAVFWLALVKACVVYQWIICMTLDYFKIFFFFFEVCK